MKSGFYILGCVFFLLASVTGMASADEITSAAPDEVTLSMEEDPMTELPADATPEPQFTDSSQLATEYEVTTPSDTTPEDSTIAEAVSPVDQVLDATESPADVDETTIVPLSSDTESTKPAANELTTPSAVSMTTGSVPAVTTASSTTETSTTTTTTTTPISIAVTKAPEVTLMPQHNSSTTTEASTTSATTAAATTAASTTTATTAATTTAATTAATTTTLATTTVATTTTGATTTTESPVVSTTTTPRKKADLVRQSSELSKEDMRKVISVHFTPATSVTRWLLEKESQFRAAIAGILSHTKFVHHENYRKVEVNVSDEDVIYVAPSPQLTPKGILVFFLVKDSNGALQDFHRTPQREAEALSRPQRRDTAEQNIYFPSYLVILALRESQDRLEWALKQNVSFLGEGSVPTSLDDAEHSAATSLFERRLDIFVPLILVATVCFMALAAGLVCARARTRTSATWDPPAGVIYRKGTSKGMNVPDSKLESGCHMASDDQCRDGEGLKHSLRINDDDAWVVPYDNSNPTNKTHLKTQFEDTKL